MANVTTGQCKGKICWNHCLSSMPAMTPCNFILKATQGHISYRIFFLPGELLQSCVSGIFFFFWKRKRMEDDHGNGSLSVNSFNGSTPTLFGLQYKLSFKHLIKRRRHSSWQEKETPKSFIFWAAAFRSLSNNILYKAVTVSQARLKWIY